MALTGWVLGGIVSLPCPPPTVCLSRPFQLGTASLESDAKNMGDILRYIVVFAFEKPGHLLNVPVSPVACRRDESWLLWWVTTFTKGAGHLEVWLFPEHRTSPWVERTGYQWLRGDFVNAMGTYILVDSFLLASQNPLAVASILSTRVLGMSNS